jgi:predicted nucleic acid-binding protein
MPESYVLDSFVLLAYFFEEPGGASFQQLLERTYSGEAVLSMTVVNLGEVAYTMALRRGSVFATAGIAAIHQWPIQLVDTDEDLALVAAEIKADRGMSYLDCFVVALAQRLGVTVVTGDPDFHRAEDLITIEWLER